MWHRSSGMKRRLLFLAPLIVFSVAASGSQPKLVSLGHAFYPPLAHQANVSGDVIVNVTINEDGSIKSAEAISGHPLLKLAAVDSALRSKFDCSPCNGTGQYQLVYTYELSTVANCCAASRDVKITQEPETQINNAAATHVIISGEHTCICDPPFTITQRVRSLKCLYLWRCSTMTR